MLWIWQHNTQAAAACATASLLLTYMCATDMRDRWLPDHATLPLLFLGLLASPVANLESRVDAFATNTALVIAWQLLMAVLTRQPLRYDAISGGDIALAAAGGAWLGMGKGQAAIAVGATLMLLSMMAMPKPGEPISRYAKLVGFDAETRTFPAGAYLAIGIWSFLAGAAWR